MPNGLKIKRVSVPFGVIGIIYEARPNVSFDVFSLCLKSNNHPFKLESIDEYIPDELKSETTALGYLQLLPGVHGTDGFFIARFRRK